MRFLSAALLAVATIVSGQAPAQRFAAVDAHLTPSQPNPVLRTIPVRNGRSEWHNATMIDLIKSAYSVEADKIVGGPSWLEVNHYEVIGKFPTANTEPRKPMLQTALADRFHLVIRQESVPRPIWVLSAGKSPKLKEADGTGETGCKPQGSASPGDTRLSLSIDGQIVSLGADLDITFNCRNMTMQAFTTGLRGMAFGGLSGTDPVLDQTELKGAWNFDVHWSIGLIPALLEGGKNISVMDAVDRQLGLKLEQKPIPTPVIVVVSVDEKPVQNPPDTAQLLPPIPAPMEFDVANVKPTDPATRGGGYQQQPGGRIVATGMAMTTLLSRAFYPASMNQVLGIPEWANTERFDLTAKAPDGSLGVTTSMYDYAPMIRSLLEDRFRLKTHTEERTLPAYTLLAAKPKLKKSDPATRTKCTNENAPAGSPPASTMLVCQNVTMDYFAAQLQGRATELTWSVLNATELAGAWDFNLIYSRNASFQLARSINGETVAGVGRGGGTGADIAAASAPTGAITIFEAMEKQIGLKLELRKRPIEVTVIDHLEQKPTDN